MISTLIAVIVAGLCVAWSAARLGQAQRFDRDGAAELLLALRRGGREHAERVAREHAEQWPAVAALVEVLQAPTRAHGVAIINEHLSDVRRDLDMGAEVPRGASRIALASGTALALLEIARGLPHGGLVMAWVVAPFVAGAVAWLACVQLGRTAERHAGRHREAWNGLQATLARLLPGEEPGPEEGGEA